MRSLIYKISVGLLSSLLAATTLAAAPVSQQSAWPVRVITSPELGLRSAFDGHDLLVNISSMNEDLRLLKQRQRLAKQGYRFNQRPLLELSGGLEGQVAAMAFSAYASNHDAIPTSDLSIEKASLQLLAMVGPWASGFLDLDYQSSPVLKRGFITIGQLDRSPLYLTVGQMYVPFGRYASDLLSTPMTLALGRARRLAVLLGASHGDVFGSVYGFRGADVVNHHSSINQWGINTGWHGAFSGFKTTIGLGYINNIAASDLMSRTAARASLYGSPELGLTAALHHAVPAINLHKEWRYGAWSGKNELITTLRRFDAADLQFNNKGAKMTALHIEIGYALPTASHPLNIAAGYERSWQSALLMPKHSVFTVLSHSFWKDTIASVEYRYDRNYKASNTVSVFAGEPIAATGGQQHRLLARLGIYF